ncbi:MAG: alpha/beta hydrolase fold domain-containing protein [Cypionkella sp.]
MAGAPHRVTARPTMDDWAILYFHGGAYMTGSPVTHLGLAGRIAQMTGLPVFLPDYRLAPEHPAPAAFEDAVVAHSALVARGYAADRVILAGDSAGGGLALALLAHLCAINARPLGLFAFSPWTDLALTGESLGANAAADVVIPLQAMARGVAVIRGDLSATDPRLSPLYAQFPKPPPVLLQVGTGELLLDDSRRMAETLRRGGGEVTLQEWPDCPHVWQLLDGYLPEARQALHEVASFVDRLTERRVTPCPPPSADS